MKRLIFVLALTLIGCGKSDPLPTYEQLKHYPLDCKKQEAQLKDLEEIKRYKNFNPPDLRSESENAYFGLLREHVWWFAYNCEE